MVISELHRGGGGLLQKIEGQIFQPDQIGPAFEDRPADDVLQLPDVTRPPVLLEQVQDRL